MRILLSNDDGVHASGLHHLAQALAAVGEVVVVAGHSNTVPALLKELGVIEPVKMKDEDYVWKILNTSTHNRILFFTNYGKVYMKTAIDLPKSGRTARGSALINDIPSLSKGERVTELLDIDAAGEDTKYLLMVTKKGFVKKTAISEYKNINKNGLIAIRLNEGDE